MLGCHSRLCPLQVPGVLKDLSFPEGARKLWPGEFFLVPAGAQRVARHKLFLSAFLFQRKRLQEAGASQEIQGFQGSPLP